MPRFTDRFLTSLALPPEKKDLIVFDTLCPRLAVRLTASGNKIFLAQWTDRASGKKRRMTLARWGAITVDQARLATQDILGRVARGDDPVAQQAERKAADEAAQLERAFTFERLVTDWGNRHLSKRSPNYAREAQRALLAAFGSKSKKSASALSKKEVVSVLDGIENRGRHALARRTLAYGRAAYRWAQQREMVASNPFIGLPTYGVLQDRDRTLTGRETRLVWDAAALLPYPFGPFFKLSLLTLQRRGEVAGARWSEISTNFEEWLIPGSRMKKGKAHLVPLSRAAVTLLAKIRDEAIHSGSDFVFTTNGKTPISGFSEAKGELDAAISKLSDGGTMQPFRLHDFRRSGASWLAKEGFDTIAIDKLLAHQSSKLSGVAAVYQRYDFAEERRAALEKWAEMLSHQRLMKRA